MKAGGREKRRASVWVKSNRFAVKEQMSDGFLPGPSIQSGSVEIHPVILCNLDHKQAKYPIIYGADVKECE